MKTKQCHFFPQKGLHAYSMDNYCPQTHVNKRQTNKLLLNHSMLKYTNFRYSPKLISRNSKVYVTSNMQTVCQAAVPEIWRPLCLMLRV